MANTSLAERQEKVARDIGGRFAANVEQALATMEVVALTNQLGRRETPLVNADGDEVGTQVELVKPPGMTDEDFHICQDAMKPRNQVPFYLDVARGRVDLAHRIAGDRSNAPQQIAALVVKKLETVKREYPVLDVTPSNGEK